MLSFPLGVFPIEPNIAVKRLQASFISDELQADAFMRQEISGSPTSEHFFRVRKAAFSWTRKMELPSLRIERLEANAGSFCCIIGGGVLESRLPSSSPASCPLLLQSMAEACQQAWWG